MLSVITDEVGSDYCAADWCFASVHQNGFGSLENLNAIGQPLLSGIEGGSLSAVETHVLGTVLFCFIFIFFIFYFAFMVHL